MRRFMNAARLTTKPPNATARTSSKTRPAFSVFVNMQNAVLLTAAKVQLCSVVLLVEIRVVRSLAQPRVWRFETNLLVPRCLFQNVQRPIFDLIIDSAHVFTDHAQTAKNTSADEVKTGDQE